MHYHEILQPTRELLEVPKRILKALGDYVLGSVTFPEPDPLEQGGASEMLDEAMQPKLFED